MRAVVLSLLLLCGCARHASERPQTILDQAVHDLRAGDFNRAQSGCERGIALARGRGELQLLWKLRLVRAEALTYASRPEEVFSELAAPVPNGAEFAWAAARKKLMLAEAHLVLHHREETYRLATEARGDAVTANALDVAVESETFLSGYLIGESRLEDAEELLRGTLPLAQSLHSDYFEAGVLVNLGLIHMKQRRYDEAVSEFEHASEKARQQAPALFGVIQNNLAVCYTTLGEPDRAIHIQEETVAHYERSGSKVLLQVALGATGESYMVKADYQAAISYLRPAFDLATELGRGANAALWASYLSAVYIGLKDWPNAEAFNQEAMRLKSSIKGSSFTSNILRAADIAAGQGAFEQAEKSYDQAIAEGQDDPFVLWDAHSGKAQIEVKRNRMPEAMKEFEASVEILEKTRSSVSSRAEFKLPFLAPRIRVYQAYIDALLGQGQVQRALAVVDSSRAQVLGERSGSATARRLPPGAFSKLASSSNAVLLSYWLAKEQSHAWVVTARDTYHVTMPGAADIQQLVTQYQGAIERQLSDPLRTPLSAGEKLYDILIAPLRQWLPTGSRVVLVPDGVLHSLSFEALPVPGEPAHYLIQDLTFEIAPSLSAAATASSAPPGRKLLLLGEANFSSPEYPPLAAASAEIAGVLRHFPPSDQIVRTKDEATPQAFLTEAKGGPFAAIHFTAHAVANRETPLESAVLLSGGRLFARDVMDLSLKADLVTVSACRGAGQRAYSGEGLIGFAWAFLRAGARNVIAGLWDVNDQSTAGFMDTLYRELTAGKRPADALRNAKLAMIASPGNLRKPYYWAPFQIYTVAP